MIGLKERGHHRKLASCQKGRDFSYRLGIVEYRKGRQRVQGKGKEGKEGGDHAGKKQVAHHLTGVRGQS